LHSMALGAFRLAGKQRLACRRIARQRCGSRPALEKTQILNQGANPTAVDHRKPRHASRRNAVRHDLRDVLIRSRLHLLAGRQIRCPLASTCIQSMAAGAPRLENLPPLCNGRSSLRRIMGGLGRGLLLRTNGWNPRDAKSENSGQTNGPATCRSREVCSTGHRHELKSPAQRLVCTTQGFRV
jgi:hypothetical protein